MRFIILAIYTVMAVGGQMLNPIQLPYPQYYQNPLTLDPMNYPYPPTFYPYPVNYFQAALEFPQSQELPLVQDSETAQEVPEMEESDGEPSLKNLTLTREARGCK